MPPKVTSTSFEGQEFFVGIDIHLKSWAVTVRCLGLSLESFTMPPDASILAGHLRKKYPGGIYHSVYEAGFCGFVAHRRLLREGIENIVTNPADVPTRTKERKRKTDKVDSRKLARELEVGSLEPIYVPTLQQQDLRSLCRLRKKLVDHSTRLKNRIKMFLHFRGVVIPSQAELPHWSNNFLLWLENLCCECENPGMHCLRIILEELRQQRARINDATRLLRQFTAQSQVIHLLRTVPGIGFVSAVILYTEIMDIQRFNTLDDLASYVGLIPDCHDSGESKHDGGMTSIGSRHLRYILTESAWVAVRKDPELLRSFAKDCQNKKKTQAIIKTARRLLNRIRFVWQNQVAYRCGEKAA